MQLFHVHTLLDIVSDIDELASWAANGPNYAEDALTAADAATSLERMEDVARLCASFGFNTLLREVERNRLLVESGCTYVELGRIAAALKIRIQDEYADILLLWIEEKACYQQDDFFGVEVGERFKDASFDIKEAGTCYALGRYTACVYHSMRVAEFGLKAIAERVKFPDDRPNWEPVLKFINAELTRNRDVMSAAFKGDIEFISGISAHMHSVNLAWRRRVAHVERTYTQEEAKRILEETRNLMQHLAGKLNFVASSL
jgi:HEPN domain-containing protein